MTHRGPRLPYSGILKLLREDRDTCLALADHLGECRECTDTDLCAAGAEMYEAFKRVRARGGLLGA